MHPALAIPEILTLIFQECDDSTLLCSAQRVSRGWHNIIQNSTPLQQKLFFLSLPEDTYPTYNTLLAKKFPSWFSPKYTSHSIEAFKNLEWAKNEDIYRYEKASWRDMLVVQPAATQLLISKISSGMLGISAQSGTKDVQDGVRMGLLYDYISKWMDDCGDEATFGVDWRGVEQYPWENRATRYPMTLMALKETDEEVIDDGGQWDGVVKVICAVAGSCCVDDIEHLKGNFLHRGYKDLKGIVWGKERHSEWN
jgi:hypothetical protein